MRDPVVASISIWSRCNGCCCTTQAPLIYGMLCLLTVLGLSCTRFLRIALAGKCLGAGSLPVTDTQWSRSATCPPPSRTTLGALHTTELPKGSAVAGLQLNPPHSSSSRCPRPASPTPLPVSPENTCTINHMPKLSLRLGFLESPGLR